MGAGCGGGRPRAGGRGWSPGRGVPDGGRAIAAEGPGAEVTGWLAAITARASGKPGSETMGVPASEA